MPITLPTPIVAACERKWRRRRLSPSIRWADVREVIMGFRNRATPSSADGEADATMKRAYGRPMAGIMATAQDTAPSFLSYLGTPFRHPGQTWSWFDVKIYKSRGVGPDPGASVASRFTLDYMLLIVRSVIK